VWQKNLNDYNSLKFTCHGLSMDKVLTKPYFYSVKTLQGVVESAMETNIIT